MKRFIPFFIIISAILIFAGFTKEDNFTVDEETPIWQVLEHLGEAPPNHALNNRTPEMIQQGEDLVLRGKTKSSSGKRTRTQSKHFKCTSCHNVVKDEGDLATMDAQAKLDYCKENNLPFLQGTSFYGVVNRSTFYNDDYQKKYAGNPRIVASNKDLKEAIQLCAVECAQGRPMKKWEIDAVLAYFWSLELKMKDLDLTKEEFTKVKSAGDADGKEIISLLKSKYRASAPAKFGYTPKDAKAGYANITGNPENGKSIYDLGCMHCHEGKKYSMYELDDSKMTFQHLKRHIPKYDRYSIYQVTRYGAPTSAGKRAYMPQYSMDKMTDQQLEDLRAYVDARSK
jgi:mono/diheme cytochrome c family protein